MAGTGLTYVHQTVESKVGNMLFIDMFITGKLLTPILDEVI